MPNTPFFDSSSHDERIISLAKSAEASIVYEIHSIQFCIHNFLDGVVVDE